MKSRLKSYNFLDTKILFRFFKILKFLEAYLGAIQIISDTFNYNVQSLKSIFLRVKCHMEGKRQKRAKKCHVLFELF